ncbi:MAG TPA: hypothetical protein VL098_12645 [Flavipsychrobacter sp.]|nr:hypothetical protein [Flavipsychrobacter sp.]
MGKINKPTGTIISKNRAAEIAGDWHGGFISALYSFASTKLYFDVMYNSYINEIKNEKPGTTKGKNDLKSLKRFFEYKHWEANK